MRFKILLLLLIIFTLAFKVYAQDYMVEFFAEHYNEKSINRGKAKKIYHTLQVKTRFGYKLLILTGEDNAYRNWLREYLNNENMLIIKVSNENFDEFKLSEAFKIDVTNIHPVIAGKWKFDNSFKPEGPPKKFKESEKVILLVDDNARKIKLLEDIIKHNGFNVTSRTNGAEAFNIFLAQPEMYKLIITDYNMPDMNGTELSQKILKIKSEIPIILCTEYNEIITKDMRPKAAMHKENFIIKPVALREIGKTIRKVLKKP